MYVIHTYQYQALIFFCYRNDGFEQSKVKPFQLLTRVFFRFTPPDGLPCLVIDFFLTQLMSEGRTRWKPLAGQHEPPLFSGGAAACMLLLLHLSLISLQLAVSVYAEPL